MYEIATDTARQRDKGGKETNEIGSMRRSSKKEGITKYKGTAYRVVLCNTNRIEIRKEQTS